MKTRVLSAIVMISLAAAAIYFGGVAFCVVITLASAVGLFEFYRAFRQKGFSPIVMLGYLYCLLIPAVFILKPEQALDVTIMGANIFPIIQLLILLAMLTLMVFKHKKISPVDCAITLLGAYYVPVLFSFFMLTRNLEDGLVLVVVGVLGSILADTFAMFGGMLFGKRKLIPSLSPKKTVAGSISSFVGSTLGVTAYGIVLNSCNLLTHPISVVHFAILGFIMGATSQIGDLSASAIKRYCGIKDFGKLIPGHGGIIDRFDSMLFNVPMVYCYIQLIYIFTK